GLPVVATAVGGVEAGVGDAGLLVAAGDAHAAAAALERIGADADERDRLVAAGLRRAEALTLENQVGRLASFLLAAPPARTDPPGTAALTGDSPMSPARASRLAHHSSATVPAPSRPMYLGCVCE